MTVTSLARRMADSTAAGSPTSMIERATLILGAFEGRCERLSLEDVVRSSGLPRSSVHRILDQLVRQGWLTHSGVGYALGERALGLAAGHDVTDSVRAAVAPHLLELYLRSGHVAHLAVLDGAMVRYLDKIGGPAARELRSRVGGRASGCATALGRAMLAWLEPEAVDGLLESTGQPNPRLESAGQPIPRLATADLARLHAELARIRTRHGIAGDRAPGSPGTTSLAIALCGPNGPVAAISLDAPGGLDPASVAPLLLEAARAICRDLFGTRAPVPHRVMAAAM